MGGRDSLFDRIVETMARASVGTTARVDLKGQTDLDEPLVRIAHVLNVLLADIDYQRSQTLAQAQRVQQEQEGRLAEAERAARLLNLGVAYVELDKSWRILAASQSFIGLMGKSEFALGRVYWEVYPHMADPESPFFRGYQSCVQSGMPNFFDAPCLPGERWVAASVYPTPEGGVVAFFRDISERRRMELALSDSMRELEKSQEQLLHSQKMEAVERLAGGVAHDFNNLLTVILSCTDLAMSSLKPGDPSMRELRNILQAGERAADLTKSLLALGRRQVLAPRVVDMNNILEGMAPMLDRMVGEDVRISLELSQELGTCRVDPGQIENVIINLVANARDAMSRGGLLTISSEPQRIPTTASAEYELPPGDYVVVSVSDTGTGMDRDTLARIFEPFFTTKALGKGTGLGLSSVFGIVAQSGGRVHADSEPGKGSVFKIYLPQSEGHAGPMPSVIAAPQHLEGTETILVVEDEDPVRAVMVSALRKYGYRILEAANAGEAFLIADHHRDEIDLLLTDLIMPRLTGRELATKLLTMSPHLKILYVSGYMQDLQSNGGLDNGHILLKPFTPRALAEQVRSILNATI